MTVSRRTLLRSAAVSLSAVGVAGCSNSGSETSKGDIQAGPGGSLTFEPKEYTASVGDTVTWHFASGGHNVSCVPDHSDQVELPDGADPFASQGVDGDAFAVEPSGATFEHTFETAGEYTYVCVPHVGADMVGTIVVEE